MIYSELLNARARYKTCPILRNVEKISGPSDPSRSSPCSAPAMFTTNKRLLQTNIRALLLRSVESWFGIGNIMGHVFIADRRTLVSIWSHDRNWWLTIQIAEGSIFCDRDHRRSQKCVSIWSQTIAELFAISDPWSLDINFFDCYFCSTKCFFFWQQLFFNLHHLISIAASFICILKKLFKVTATLKFAAEIINHFHQLLKLPHVHCAVGRRSSAILLPI